jgi:hypothetical protein
VIQTRNTVGTRRETISTKIRPLADTGKGNGKVVSDFVGVSAAVFLQGA